MQHDQQDHAVGAGESAPFASTADDGSLFSAATTTPTADTDNTASSGHATGEHKEQTSPTDLAASPRSGAATGFVAPSSYLRPLAATRDREGPHRTGHQPFTASESGAKRPMHPLDREQREGLVSGFHSALWKKLHAGILECIHAFKEALADRIHSAQSEPSSRSARPTMSCR
jgi:hypothetical protein